MDFVERQACLHALVRASSAILLCALTPLVLEVSKLISRWAWLLPIGTPFVSFLPLLFLFLEWPRKHTLQGMRLPSIA